jgi:nitroimidazol reductase NimA-like FMN-containing flavoprotein (pyridoxamine 5'-phosphate oxidase superfamily)
VPRRRLKLVGVIYSEVDLSPTIISVVQVSDCDRRKSNAGVNMSEQGAPSYPVDAMNRVKRRHDRGFYDHETVHTVLDAAAMCHVSYVVDGQPFCTPTLFWREGSRLYWHGSNASRMLRNLSEGEPTCLTVTHLDSLVLARCGFNHSADYRSVMAYGHSHLVEDPAEKSRALYMMVDRFFPGRTAQLRETVPQEINATTVLMMDIERASAKIRAKGVADDDEDYLLPIYAERLPIQMVMGAAEPCPRLQAGVTRPANLAGYRAGRRLEDAVAEAHAIAYPD